MNVRMEMDIEYLIRIVNNDMNIKKRFAKNAQLTRSVISGFGICSQRAWCKNWRRSGSVHCLRSSKQPSGHCLPICKTCMGRPCLPGSESLASSYVDGKNRQRVFGILTVECRVGIFVSVRKKGPWVNRVQPGSLSVLP